MTTDVAANGSSIMNPPEQSVLDYRMGALEGVVKELSNKFDNFATHYPTMNHLGLILKPMQDDIDTLKADKEKVEEAKRSTANTLRIAILMCIVNPLAASLVTYVLTGGR